MVKYHAPILVTLLLLAFLAAPVAADNITYNSTYTLDETGYYPWDLWLLSGLIGLALFLLSLRSPTSAMDTERDAIISVMAWIPIGYCMVASWSGVDKVIGYGTNAAGLLVSHQLYSFTDIAALMFVFLVVAIVNTVRIVALHKVLKVQSEQND
jgi:nitric oxide reductase large subunit